MLETRFGKLVHNWSAGGEEAAALEIPYFRYSEACNLTDKSSRESCQEMSEFLDLNKPQSKKLSIYSH